MTMLKDPITLHRAQKRDELSANWLLIGAGSAARADFLAVRKKKALIRVMCKIVNNRFCIEVVWVASQYF